jgi:predicted tellurium resistance membrane protein TerC
MDLSFPVFAMETAVPAAGAHMPADLFSVASIAAFITLAVMEIVLGIDNVVFVAIIVDKLPKEKQRTGRNLGLVLALILRLGLLFGITWIMGLNTTVVPLPEGLRGFLHMEDGATGLSGKDLILLAGGLFLLYKASKEIFEKLEGEEHHGEGGAKPTLTLGSAIFQIIILDLVFSLDSVITAVGMVDPDKVIIMVAAMIVAVSTMIAVAGSIQAFVNKHPSIKILALSFLNLIGVMLLLEGFHQHVNKGYIYTAMAFSLAVELLNMRFRKKQKAVVLHEPHPESLEAPPQK